MTAYERGAVQLEVSGLSVEYAGRSGPVRAVRNVSFKLRAGELLGLVGESGSGKSTLAGALIGDLPGSGTVAAGGVMLHSSSADGSGPMDIWRLSERERRELWGRRLAIVLQDPLGALNPSYRIGGQIDEAVGRRPELIETSPRDRTLQLLAQVRMPDPERIARRYPHQLSGGQQQRAVLAMALAAAPDVLILDEPTTGLDVTTEARVLDLIAELKSVTGAAILFITHNLAVIAQMADRVAVMYAGELVELADVRTIFRDPSAPYTAGLLASVPRLESVAGPRPRLRTIPGFVPAPGALPPGCAFEPRCPFARDRCRRERPPLDPIEAGPHLVRCFYSDDVRRSGWPADQLPAAMSASAEPGALDLVAGDRLTKIYGPTRRRFGLFGPTVARPAPALNDVSFEVGRAETLGIVGESGGGKTTLANCVAGLISPTKGSVSLDGRPLAPTLRGRSRDQVRRIQMLFQNADASLNPHHDVRRIVGRAVRVLGRNGGDPDKRLGDLLREVGLGPEYAGRLPAELSGGEKQRVAAARALAGAPDLVISDEATSALDVSVRAALLNLFNDLQARDGLAYLFVSHDLSAVRHVAHRVLVLYQGTVMEEGPTEAVFSAPHHPYTEALMSAIPVPDPNVPRSPIRLDGPAAGPDDAQTGCPFHTRCPRKIGDLCEREPPPWRRAGDGHHILCHIPIEDLAAAQRGAAGAPEVRGPRSS